MSAGKGVTHSELNGSEDRSLHFLQVWVQPAETETEPRYDEGRFPVEERRGRLHLVVSPDGGDGSLTIGQDVELHLGALAAGDVVEHAIAEGRKAWLQATRGELLVDGREYTAPCRHGRSVRICHASLHRMGGAATTPRDHRYGRQYHEPTQHDRPAT